MSEIEKKKRAPGKSDAPVLNGGDKSIAGKSLPPATDQSRDSEAIERAVYDGMQDLRVKKPR